MKKKYTTMLPFILLLFITAYLIGWHLALVYIMPDIKLTEISAGLVKITDLYLLAVMVFLAVVFFIFKSIQTRWLRNILYASIIAVALLFTVIRIIDWGTMYFAGQHIDNNFWYHAFYVDGTSFLVTKTAALLIVSNFSFFFIFAGLLKWFTAAAASDSGSITANPRQKTIAFAVLLVVVNIPLIFGIEYSGNPVKAQYASIPEIEAISSFIDYAARPHQMDNVTIDPAVMEKIKQAGIMINQNAKYPLLKKSIYLDPKSRLANKPHIPVGTNIIIVFLESFNEIFLHDEIHGFKGLSPNVHDAMKSSFRFTHMYNASYPTERGMIAALGSTLYLLDRIRGPHEKLKPPVPCKMLLISDILKKRGYTNIHVKGGSGLFGGLKSSFENKQHYDKFYSAESLELQMRIRGKRKQGWGINDIDLYPFIISQLENNMIQQPFLLTINSLDMHPPFDFSYNNPAAHDITILNAIYSTDKSFGLLWDYFKNSKYRNNTVFIVTADHAMGTGTDLKKFFATFNYSADWHCDMIPCFILFPGDNPWNGRSDDTLCTNLDIVPSLLDMMDLDCENPFVGLTIFSERKKHPFTLTEFYTIDYAPIMKRIPPSTAAAIRSIGWKSEDEELLRDYMKKIVLGRILYPDDEEKK